MKRPSCQALVNGYLEVPCNKPPIEQIIFTGVKPEIDKVIVIKDKIIVRSHLEISIEYVGDVSDGSQPVHYAHFNIKFDCFIDYPCIKPGDKVKVSPNVEYSEFTVEGEKTISKLIVIKATVVDVIIKEDEPGYCTSVGRQYTRHHRNSRFNSRYRSLFWL